MRLEGADRALLRGDHGEVAREAMEYQLQVAEFYGAERMVELAEATAGIDFALNGDFGLETTEKLAARGGRFRIFTKCAFLSHDLYQPERYFASTELVEKQRRYLEAQLSMGAVPTFSSVPHRIPQFGEQVAWQGSAIVANSVFGARSTLDGPIGGLMAALAGRAPLLGVRLAQNRLGTVAVKVSAHIGHSTDWGALGYAVGKKLPRPGEIPVFVDLPPFRGMGNRQAFEVAMVTPSAVEMYHVVGLTPEAPTLRHPLPDGIARSIEVTEEDMLAVYDELSMEEDEVDLVQFGGHHVELDDFPRILAALDGRKVKDRVRLWISTAPQYKPLIEAMGWHHKIEKAGGELLYGTSLMLMAPSRLAQQHGLRRVVVDSCKTAKYVRGFGMTSCLRTVEGCIAAAVSGRLSGPARPATMVHHP